MEFRRLPILALAAAAICITAGGASAQASRLTVSGMVSELSVHRVESNFGCREDMLEDCERAVDPNDVYYEIRVNLRFVNHLNVPLIVPDAVGFAGSKQILFLDSLDPASEPTAIVPDWNLMRYDNLSVDFVNSLIDRTPAKYFRTIEPGKDYTVSETLRLKTGFEPTFDPMDGVKLKQIIPQYPYFKIRYSFPLPSSAPVAAARTRWKTLGELFTNADGNEFFYETEAIPNEVQKRNKANPLPVVPVLRRKNSH